MGCDYIELANKGVQSLSPYQAGKSIEELQRELGLEHIIKLASNENPLPTSKSVLKAISQASSELTRYPDSNGFELKNALAERLEVDTNQITLGNGSNNILDLIARIYLEPGKSAIYSQHAFIIYKLIVQASGGHGIATKAKQWGHDFHAMVDAITDDTRLMFIANPNNPTGTASNEAELVDLLDKVPANVLVVLDEAYFEYNQTGDVCDGVALLKHYPNLIVTRTFSKAYGLAGLRLGYAIASAGISEVLNRVRSPFNVNSLAMSAACAALEDRQYLEQACRINEEGMQQMKAGLKELGMEYIPSQANFLAVDIGKNASDMFQKLLENGVIVRPIGAYEMPNHLRVTIGLEEENTTFLNVLKKLL